MKIQIETIIKKDIETVWDTFTNPKHIINWNFAGDDWFCPKAFNDLKVGGRFNSTMSARDNSMSFDFEGEYIFIEDKKRIDYIILDMQYGEKYIEKGRKVSIYFNQKDFGIEIIEIFDSEDLNSVDLQKKGWQMILDRFKNYTENL